MPAQKKPDRITIGGYRFVGGYPAPETIQKAYDDADLTRAIHAYKFFFPTVSIAATWDGNERFGLVPNRVAMVLMGNPAQTVMTPNSDTPYAGISLDLTSGPIVVELPPGPLMCVVNDLNQRYVMDLVLPGPDAGKGGKHLILPPGYQGTIPDGYYTGMPTTNRALLMLRAIPPEGDMRAAIATLKTVKVYPLEQPGSKLKWIEIGERPEEFTPGPWENNIGYWKRLHQTIDSEPPFEAYRMEYGDLAGLGIEKGKPFKPDARMKKILERAARIANAQMRVQSFGDRRPDRVTWKDRKWEWATLRPENGTFDTAAYKDLDAREKWFFQAQIESPAMFRRTAAAGSLYWLGARDRTGAFLRGSKTYRLRVPLPVPAKLFWSITVYDPETRSEIKTPQKKAALRSLVELQNSKGTSVDLFFGPKEPKVAKNRWVQTLPKKGWFAYFRIYGPDTPAFDGSWKPGDFELVK
jgi:hypothetical protein